MGGTSEISFHLYVVLGISTPHVGNQEKLDLPPLTPLPIMCHRAQTESQLQTAMNISGMVIRMK